MFTIWMRHFAMFTTVFAILSTAHFLSLTKESDEVRSTRRFFPAIIPTQFSDANCVVVIADLETPLHFDEAIRSFHGLRVPSTIIKTSFNDTAIWKSANKAVWVVSAERMCTATFVFIKQSSLLVSFLNEAYKSDLIYFLSRFFVVTSNTECISEQIFTKIPNLNMMSFKDMNSVEIKTRVLFPPNPRSSQFQVVNKWNGYHLLNNSISFYPDKTNNLNKNKVNVSAFDLKPYLYQLKKKSEDGCFEYFGYFEKLITSISQNLNSSVCMKPPPDGKDWGYVLPNGTAVGAQKELINGYAQFSGNSFSIDLTNHLTVDFSFAISHSCVNFIVPRNVASSEWAALTRIFTWELWAITIAMYIVSSLAIYILMYAMKRSSEKQQYPADLFSFEDALFFNFSILTLQSPPLELRYNPSERFATFLYMYATLITAAYVSILTATLITPPKPPQIDSVEKLVESGLHCASGLLEYFKSFFKTSSDKIEVHISKVLTKMVRTPEEGLDLVSKGNISLLWFKEDIIYRINNNVSDTVRRRIYVIKKCFITSTLGLAIAKKSVLKNRIDFVISNIVAFGLTQKWLCDTLYGIRPCTMEEAIEPKLPVPLSLDNMKSAFALLLIGLSISIVHFIITKLIEMFKRCQSIIF